MPFAEKLYEHFRRIKVVFGDAAYGRNDLPNWVLGTFRCRIGKPPSGSRMRAILASECVERW